MMSKETFMHGFLDELEKAAASFRSLGLTDPAARKNFAKALRSMPKGGPEGRHQGIKGSKEGFSHWKGKPEGRAMIAMFQKTMADAKT